MTFEYPFEYPTLVDMPSMSFDGQLSAFSKACRVGDTDAIMVSYDQLLSNMDTVFAMTTGRLFISNKLRDIKNAELVFACTNGNIAVVRQMLEMGADASIYGGFPLSEAAEFGHVDVASELIWWGAKVNMVDYILSAPVANGHLDMVKFLVSRGARVSENDYHAFTTAISHKQTKIVNYFISLSNEHGLSLDKRPEYIAYINKAQKVLYFCWIQKCYDMSRPCGKRMAEQNLAAFLEMEW